MYKVRKVKQDKKLVRDLLAMDLPAKPRYPIFRAVAGLCLKMAIVETDEPTQAEDIPGANAAPTYVGQGAYMDGQSSFVDLEANRNAGDSGSNSAKRSKRRRRSKDNVSLSAEKPESATEKTVQRTPTSDVNTMADKEPQQMLETEPVQSNVSDLSEASESEVDADKSVYSAGSERSYATSQSSVEPSDFSEIAYTLSSDDEVLLDGQRSSNGGGASVTEASDGVISE